MRGGLVLMDDACGIALNQTWYKKTRQTAPPNEEILNQAYIVDALRTPVGRRRGALSGVHAADLGAHVL